MKIFQTTGSSSSGGGAVPNVSVTSYTPASFQGFGTPTAVTFLYSISSGMMTIIANFASGTPTAAEARAALPAGYTVSALVPSVAAGTGVVCGTYGNPKGLATQKGGFVFVEQSVAYMTFGAYGTIGTTAVNALAKSNGDVVVEGGDRLSFIATFPVS